jgi:two-component system, OmpR family, sensor kinase
MTLSLRGRLLIGVILLVFIGLLVSGVATYELLQKSLFDSIDQQLTSRATVDSAVAALASPDCHVGPGASASFAPGTTTALVAADGSVVKECVAPDFGGSAPNATPVLPKSFPYSGPLDQPVTPFTVKGSGTISAYRMTYWHENSFSQYQALVFAVPLTNVISTLSSLLLVESIIGVAVLGATAFLAFVIIDLGLRPLRRMGATAGQIAAGDLSRRVEPATSKTEIGRLGLALNAMLSQIEAAFAQSKASEQRLRRFIADASHELRTPLTSIRGYSEMLRRGAAESPADADLARRRIEEESVRMSTLVDDMLLIARLDQGRPLETRPVNLLAIARDAVDDARAVAPQRSITLNGDRPIVVTGDDTRLRQVVGNLMRNALVHTPPATPIEVAVTTEDSVARMSVSDHGPGLRHDQLERIFEPFYRVDPSRSRDSGGAGLGLSIVNAVVVAHGGHVTVRETSGGGATFEVELPLASAS